MGLFGPLIGGLAYDMLLERPQKGKNLRFYPLNHSLRKGNTSPNFVPERWPNKAPKKLNVLSETAKIDSFQLFPAPFSTYL